MRSGQGVSFRYWSWWLGLFVAAWVVCYGSLAPAPFALLRQNWLFVPLGFAGAVVGNISAVGGGIVFIPAMMFLFKLAPVAALKIALASQMFGMSSGAIGWIQKKVVPLTALKLTVPGLLLGSLCSSLVIHPSAMLVKLLFGPVSIGLGIVTLVLLRSRRQSTTIHDIPEDAAIPLFFVSLVGGLITGWVAIGEGELVAALLMIAYGVEVESCIGLGVLLLAINSIFLTALHILFLGGIPWGVAGFTLLGCVFGARFAPFISRRANPTILKVLFALITIGDGTLFIFQSLTARPGP